MVEVVVQEDGWEQAEFECERGARREALDDLPGAAIILMRVGSDEIESPFASSHSNTSTSPAGYDDQALPRFFSV